MKFTKFTVFCNVADAMADIPYVEKSFFPALYYNKIIVAECKIEDMYKIRLWKNRKYFSIDKTMCSSNNIVGALDYTHTTDQFKIEYMCVKDNDDMGSLTFDVKYTDAKSHNALMIAIAERKASELDMKSMIMDTHQSLRLYEQYYKDEKFILTGNIASDHSAWVEIKRKVNKV